jgi:hypothetical protein
VGRAGFEPATIGLKDRCSTTELPALARHYSMVYAHMCIAPARSRSTSTSKIHPQIARMTQIEESSSMKSVASVDINRILTEPQPAP